MAKTPLGRNVGMFIFNRHTLKISNGSIIAQESFCIGVLQKVYFEEDDCVAKTPLGRKIKTLQAFHKRHEAKSAAMLKRLQQAAVNNENLFEELMETVKYCSLGQITNALYSVGGQYRRNM